MTVSLLSGSIPVILIVDDDEVIRMLLHQFLEGEGYAVIEAENGHAALETLGKESVDLVILDIAMPGLDGPEICAHICSSMPDPPPVLMITALDDEKSIERSYNAGAVDYIRKPLRWPVLKNRILYILGSHRAKQELELLSRNYEMILDAAANGICGVGSNGLISYINPAALKMLGYSNEEAKGSHCREVFKITASGGDLAEDCCPYFEQPEMNVTICYDEGRMQRKDGSSFPVDFRSTPIKQNQRLVGGVLVFQDITERQEAAELIRYMANHDPLTNLPNRNYFRRRLPQAISLANRYGRILCLLFIDLDRFKPINDQFGHGVGDIVLMQVAERLRQTLRTSDSVCRLGGDEFVILLESTETLEGAIMVAQRSIESLNEPIEAGDHVCFIGASIGISVFPNDCHDAETMLRHADIAMYEAKKKGRNCWQLYSD
jgi:diguanylate cyclase (GGDEF)-like protein/PAS domain S-box-containing protein